MKGKPQKPSKLDQVNNFLQVIKPGETVIIGCSGGPDSTFLSYICHKTLPKREIKVILAHLNHNLRGKESHKNEEFVKKLGEQLGFTTEIKSAHFTNFSEEKGRKARLDFFEKCRQKHNAGYILLAHHADDSTETILMNFVRGSGLTGLQGISEQNGEILRPLLGFSKEEILSHLKKHKITYHRDASNEDNNYTRNFYRNQIIPLLKEKNPNLNQSLKKTAQNLAEIEDFLATESNKWLKANSNKGAHDLKNFRSQHPALQKEILRQLYKKTLGHLQDLESKHLEEIVNFLMQSHSGKRKNLGKKVEIIIKDKTFRITEV